MSRGRGAPQTRAARGWFRARGRVPARPARIARPQVLWAPPRPPARPRPPAAPTAPPRARRSPASQPAQADRAPFTVVAKPDVMLISLAASFPVRYPSAPGQVREFDMQDIRLGVR